MSITSVTIANVAGLVFGLIASLLLALDLWTPRTPELREPHDLSMLVAQVIEALRLQGDEREKELRRLHVAVSSLAMHRTASSSAAVPPAARTRLAGRIGLVLLALGFFAQLVGSLGAVSTVQPGGVSPDTAGAAR